MFFANWRIFFHNYIKKDSATTVIPLIGGGSGALGLWLLPVVGDESLFLLLIPLLIEWGSFPLLLVAGFFLVRRNM
jgi:hypothetical protein